MNDFSQFWRLGSPRSRGQHIQYVMTSLPGHWIALFFLITDKVEGTRELCLCQCVWLLFYFYALLHQQGFLVQPWKGVVRGSILALCLISVGKPGVLGVKFSISCRFLVCVHLVTQSCPTLWYPMESSPAGSSPLNSPDKDTREGCHFLLQRFGPGSPSLQADSLPTEQPWTWKWRLLSRATIRQY